MFDNIIVISVYPSNWLRVYIYSATNITGATQTKLTNWITGKYKYIPRKLVVNHNYHGRKTTAWIKSNQLRPTR